MKTRRLLPKSRRVLRQNLRGMQMILVGFMIDLRLF